MMVYVNLLAGAVDPQPAVAAGSAGDCQADPTGPNCVGPGRLTKPDLGAREVPNPLM